MKQTLSAAFFATTFLWCSSATTAVIERDWLAPGDELLTYDTVNQREWLDFPVSRLQQFGGTELEGNTMLEAITAAKQELLPGGLFAGFTLAKREDVIELVASAGVDLSTLESADATSDQMLALIELLGPTIFGAPPGAQSLGFLDEINQEFNGVSQEQPYFAATLRVSHGNFRPLIAKLEITSSSDRFSIDTLSLSLFREAIPEPSSILLAVFAISIVASVSRPSLSHI